jgi:hypothetical protein
VRLAGPGSPVGFDHAVRLTDFCEIWTYVTR